MGAEVGARIPLALDGMRPFARWAQVALRLVLMNSPTNRSRSASGLALKRELLAWYGGADGAAGRAARDLPWRRTSDPYAIWVSETMLQQTRAATVTAYWERFLRELPTVQTLAEAPESQVLALWSGLGYYRRARMLHAAARRVVALHGGILPRDHDALVGLEGVGAYTAGAVASIAFKQRVAAVDGNVSRVLARVAAIEEDVTSARGKARVQAEAEALAAIDEGDPGDWTQAVMELGALVCTPRQPRCAVCPVQARCRAFKEGGIEYASTLPRKAPKRAPTVVEQVAIVVDTGTAVLLARRRAETLYGGLWEVPTAPRSAKRRLARRLGVALSALHVAGDVVHISPTAACTCRFSAPRARPTPPRRCPARPACLGTSMTPSNSYPTATCLPGRTHPSRERSSIWPSYACNRYSGGW
jgi:A/G-specific adenine glycosylase